MQITAPVFGSNGVLNVMASRGVETRDVFICFSKSRPGEANVAIALKDVLEQNGLFAFEYEDWSWVADGLTDEVDVDRATLRQMLSTCSVVVLISPHTGDATAGVETELAELRTCRSPVILLHWSPGGWHPILVPDRFDGLNIVWAHEGTSRAAGDVADNECEFIARQLGAASWLACQLHRLRLRHATTAGALLASLPAESQHPLLNLRLQRPADEGTHSNAPGESSVLATEVADRADRDALADFVSFWRRGTDLMAAAVAGEAKFSLARPLRTFRDACESLCQAAEKRMGTREISSAERKERGLTLARLNRPEEAIAVLTGAVPGLDESKRYEVFQAIAMAQEQADPQAAIRSFTSAIECSPLPEITCTLMLNRGVLKMRVREHAGAVADFSFVASNAENAALRQSALQGRARAYTELKNYDGAMPITPNCSALRRARRAPPSPRGWTAGRYIICSAAIPRRSAIGRLLSIAPTRLRSSASDRWKRARRCSRAPGRRSPPLRIMKPWLSTRVRHVNIATNCGVMQCVCEHADLRLVYRTRADLHQTAITPKKGRPSSFSLRCFHPLA